MRITNENFKDKFNSLKNREGKDRVYYKLISFKTETNYQGVNFKLAPNVLIAIFVFGMVSLLFVLVFGYFLQVKLEGILYLGILLLVGSISYYTSSTLTEKLFKKQIDEFSHLLTEWKKSSS